MLEKRLTLLLRWRKAWSDSLGFRFLLLGLAPLVVALPLVIFLLAFVWNASTNAQLASRLRSSLAGSQNYLNQTSAEAKLRLTQWVKSERLLQSLRSTGDTLALTRLLRTAAENSDLDFLLLATVDGKVIASSTGAHGAQALPDSYVLRQARFGVANVAFERFSSEQMGMLIPHFATRAPSALDAGSRAEPALDSQGLMITAAAHLPLEVNLPDAILMGGIVLNRNRSMADHMREIVFPIDSLPEGTEGMVSIYLGGTAIAASRQRLQGEQGLGHQLASDIPQTVMGQGKSATWIGPLNYAGVSHMAGFDAIVNGDGQPIGMVGVAFPDTPYRTTAWLMLGGVAGVLALAMLALSALFWRAGGELRLRIQKISDTMNAVRRGQRSERVGQALRNDELGVLARDFDELLDTIARQDKLQRSTQEELLQMSQKLAREHEQLTMVIHGTRAGTWGWNIQSGEVEFNERWAGILGYQLAQLQPLSIETWRRLAHPQDLLRSDQELKKHFRGDQAFYDCEIRMRHKDGHWVWVHDRGQVSSWTPDGKPEWMYGTHLDITQRREAEEGQAELLARLQRLSSNVPGVLFQFLRRADGSSCYPYASAGIQDVYGCTPKDVEDDATPATQAVSPDDTARVQASMNASAATLTQWHELFRVNHPVKGQRWMEGMASPVRGADGSTTWHGYVHDVTDQQSDRERLKLAASVYEASQEGILITDARRIVIDVNQAFTRITGYSREEALGREPGMLKSGEHTQQFYDEMMSTLAASGRWQGEIWNRRKSGETYPELLSISAVHDDLGNVSHYVAIFTDISNLKAHQQELDRMAHFDALTGIPNRRMLGDRLSQAVALARRTHAPLAVCMMDIDGFKPVNDTFGHEAGDRLLVEIAQRLSHIVRKDETVARLGGDEFVLIFRVAEGANQVFERVLQAMRAPIALDEGTVNVTASLGVSYLRAGVADGDQLLREADHALYQAKALGRNRYAVFRNEVSEPAQ